MFIYSCFSFNSLVELWIDKKPDNFREKTQINQIRGYLHIGISGIIKGKTIFTGNLPAEIMQNKSEFCSKLLHDMVWFSNATSKLFTSFAIFMASEFFADYWYIKETKRNKRETILSSMTLYYQ